SPGIILPPLHQALTDRVFQRVAALRLELRLSASDVVVEVPLPQLARQTLLPGDLRGGVALEVAHQLLGPTWGCSVVIPAVKGKRYCLTEAHHRVQVVRHQ